MKKSAAHFQSCCRKCATPSGSAAVKDLLNGQPYGLASCLSFDDLLLQLVEPLAGFEHLPYQLVAAHEDAALSVVGSVAGMDADAAEHGNAEEDG